MLSTETLLEWLEANHYLIFGQHSTDINQATPLQKSYRTELQTLSPAGTIVYFTCAGGIVNRVTNFIGCPTGVI